MRYGAASRRNDGRPRQAWEKPRRPSPSRRNESPRKNLAPGRSMDLYHRSVALYGRFSLGQRDRLQREIAQRGGLVARDLTRRSGLLVIGRLSSALIDSGLL